MKFTDILEHGFIEVEQGVFVRVSFLTRSEWIPNACVVNPRNYTFTESDQWKDLYVIYDVFELQDDTDLENIDDDIFRCDGDFGFWSKTSNPALELISLMQYVSALISEHQAKHRQIYLDHESDAVLLAIIEKYGIKQPSTWRDTLKQVDQLRYKLRKLAELYDSFNNCTYVKTALLQQILGA